MLPRGFMRQGAVQNRWPEFHIPSYTCTVITSCLASRIELCWSAEWVDSQIMHNMIYLGHHWWLLGLPGGTGLGGMVTRVTWYHGALRHDYQGYLVARGSEAWLPGLPGGTGLWGMVARVMTANIVYICHRLEKAPSTTVTFILLQCVLHNIVISWINYGIISLIIIATHH